MNNLPVNMTAVIVSIARDQILETVVTFHFSGGKVYSLNKGCHTYDGPNGSLFISILLHNAEFRILNSEICTTNFGIRNCEVYIIWASGNS